MDDDKLRNVEENDLHDIERLIEDVNLECMTYDNEIDRQLRCQRLLEAAIFTENAIAVKVILKHPQISLRLAKYRNLVDRDSHPALISLRADCAKVLKVIIEEEGMDDIDNPRCCGNIKDGDIDKDRTCNVHGSIFETACKDGRLNCVRYLLQRRAIHPTCGEVGQCTKQNVLRISKSSESCMDDDVRRRKVVYYGAVAAVENDREEILKELLEVGILDVNAVIDYEIGTVLHVAAQCNSIRCTRLLLSSSLPSSSCQCNQRVDLEAIATDHQQTPLMTAAEHNSVEVMEMLLAAGADIDRQTNECSSALIVSCHFGHMQCVELLLAKGANPHLKNRWGFTALYMGTDTPAILERMLREPVDVNEHCGERQEVPLHLASVIGSVDAINSLLERGAEINRRTYYNENGLWLAIWKEHTNAARVLIQNNIDLDAESNGWQVYIWRYLPIEVALGLRNYDIVRMLLVAGCKLHNCYYFRSEKDVGPLADVGIPWVRLRSEAFDYIRADKDNFVWFKEMLTSPTSLKNICRRIVRKILRTPIRPKMKRLPLPVFLQDYLLMKDF